MRKLSMILVLAMIGACSGTGSKGAQGPTAGEGGSTAGDGAAYSIPPAELKAPLPNDKMGVTIHRLSNGLTVYISTERSKPQISAWIAIRAGSRHDPADSTGLAHYLEHMVFKGTSTLGTVNFDK
jgi:hypothetical protein